MLFSRYILLMCVFFMYVSGYDAMDLTGFQVVRFRKYDKIENMTVVLRNILRNSKKAQLYLKKYETVFKYRTVKVIGNEAIFENLSMGLGRHVDGRVYYSTVTLQNNTECRGKDVMEMQLIKDSDEEVPHECLRSPCRIIIDYHETSTSVNKKETPQSSKAVLFIKPDNIYYTPNSKHNISCFGYDLGLNYVLSLVKINNGRYVILKSTTSNTLKDELYLTEQDNGTSLYCYIEWKNDFKYSNRCEMYLLLDNVPVKKSAHDRNAVSDITTPATRTQHGRNSVSDISTQVTSPRNGKKSISDTSTQITSAQNGRNAVSDITSPVTRAPNGRNSVSDISTQVTSAQNGRHTVSDITTPVTSTHGRNAVSDNSTPVTSETDWKNVGLITTIIVIVILIIIIVFLVKRAQMTKSQSSHSVSFMKSLKNNDTKPDTCDRREVFNNLEQWNNNKPMANGNIYDVSNYYSYATNELHGEYCNLENTYYEYFKKE